MSSRIDRYGLLVRAFSARVVLFHDTVAHRLGMNATDLKVLRLLGNEALTAGQLVDHTGLTGAAITALVDRLEAGGWVTRIRDEVDRRRVTVRAVPAKLRQIDRLYDGQYAAMEKVLARYSAAEFEVIADLLGRTSEVLAEQTTRLREEAP